MNDVDVVVVGAGFGGLGAAIGLAERGLRVRLHEALSYPGGCASTFSRHGYRIDAGATQSTGLGPDGLFGRWITRYGLPVRVTWPDPVMALRADGLELPLHRDRDKLRAHLMSLPGAPVDGLRSFFHQADRVADPLWALFADEDRLPPFDLRALLTNARHLPSLLPLLGAVGRPLSAVMARHGVEGFRPLRLLLDYLCQITVQAPASEADALFALAATDYPWRGTGHVHGGIGGLAEGLVEAARSLGVDVRLADRVQGVVRRGEGFVVSTRSGEARCRAVVANQLPKDAASLVGADPSASPLADVQARVDAGWGAVTLYRVVREAPGMASDAQHWMLVGDEQAPLWDGNHTLASISSADEHMRSPVGTRTVTASTHLRLDDVRDKRAAGEVVAAVQARMRAVIALRAPELSDVVDEMPGSPRTFQRFTRRSAGAAGGPARVVRWRSYVELGPTQAAPGVWLVGDSVFPGQSTLATAIGGVRVAEAVKRGLG